MAQLGYIFSYPNLIPIERPSMTDGAVSALPPTDIFIHTIFLGFWNDWLTKGSQDQASAAVTAAMMRRSQESRNRSKELSILFQDLRDLPLEQPFTTVVVTLYNGPVLDVSNYASLLTK